MLFQTRLLTLTGAGGVGKTRLALWVAELLRHRFPDGVWVVELASLEDDELLESTVSAALGLCDTGERPAAVLANYLADKRVLLVLDNCEHLRDACARLVEGLLAGASRLRILATSRQTLRIYGEQVLAVPPLSVPDPDEAVRAMARREAVRLFAARAASVQSGFAIDRTNASAIAWLCRRLDGIPLAIELAAARLPTMPIERLVRGLDEHLLNVPTGGSPTGLPRHRTLRAAIDWSFGMCSPAEQRLWSRLSIFAGSIALETAEAVCAGDGITGEDVLEVVAGLVDKSILVAEQRGARMRYRMLDSIRAYGRERLSASDEQTLRGRYRDHYWHLTRQYRTDRLVPDQFARFWALHLELPNLRVALDLCLREPRDASIGLEIASELWSYWVLSGALTEGRYWLERGLELVPEPSTTRTMALWADAQLALHQGDLAAATPRLEECRNLARRLEDDTALAFVNQALGMAALSAGDGRRGLALMEDAIARHRACGDVDAVGVSLFQAAAFGSVEDSRRAAELGEELLELAEARGAPIYRAYALLALGIAASEQGDWHRTEALTRESAMLLSVIKERWGLTQCVEILAWTAQERGEHERAARLLGVAHALWQAIDSLPTELTQYAQSHQRCAAQTRLALGGRAFATAFRRGTRLGLDRALAYALQDGPADGEGHHRP